MDLATVLADKSLLPSLSREYELLKATHASIDWQDWITARLKLAAARRTSGSSTHATFQHQHSVGTLQQLEPARRHANLSLRTPNKTLARHSANTSALQSRRSSAADPLQAPAQQAPAQQWQAQDVTNTQLGQHVEPPKPSLVRLHSSGDTWHQVAPLPYAQLLPSQLPPHSGPQPHWVAAARLGTALQASKVVSTMHAATERERRLAAAAAVARQQLDLGMSDIAVLSGACSEQQLQPAAQEQLQQMAKLTQEVVEQNQLLQQAMKQQQAQLSEHQGLLTTVLQRSGGGAVWASSSSAGAVTITAQPGAQQQQQPAACADVAEPVRSPDKLRDQIKDSWLVKRVLQQSPNGKSGQGVSGAVPAAPDFIRIAGAAKQLPKRPGTDQQQAAAAAQPKQLQAAAADSTDDSTAAGRRKQLKAVLRQLLTKGAVGTLPNGLAGLVEGLKGLQSSSTQQQAQAQATNAGAQAHAASLVALLQQQQQQQQQQTGGAQLSKAQLLVLQRRKAQEEERKRQQEQGEQQEDSSKPGWQSEVYVPPPARMLRVKKGGAADVWNAADNNTPGAARTTPSKPAGSRAQPPRKKPGQRTAAGSRAKQSAGRSSSTSNAGGRKSLASVLYGSRWRVDGGLKLQEQQQGASEGRVVADNSRLARVEEATTQVLQAVARLEQRVQQQQQQMPQQQRPVPRRSSVTGSPQRRSSVIGTPAKAPLQLQDPAALAGLLSQLELVEQQEKDIRERWFGNRGSAGTGSSSAQAGAAGDGRGAGAADADATTGVTAAQASSPEAQQVAQHAEHAEAAVVGGAGQQQLALVPLQQQQQYQDAPSHGVLDAQQQCALSPAAMKLIKVGRQRFLRHQAMLDGAMHELGSSGQHGQGIEGDRTGGATALKSSRAVLQPDQVVEAVADLLLDELLLQEAQDLDGFCDAFCDQLIEAEFAEA